MTSRRELISKLSTAVGEENVLWRPEDLLAYQFDATVEQARPHAVVFPETVEEVQATVRICNDLAIAVTPRGAGTGLSGGAVPRLKGVVIATARMRKIISLDPCDRIAIAEPGVPNIALSEAAAPHGLFYAPDPSSQKACTIGGNVAENAGGAHCLALGVTTNHVTGVEIVTAAGDITWLGGQVADPLGYDLRGAFIGSEGTLGIATKIAVRLEPLPASVITLLATFDEMSEATDAVSAIIGAGLIPAAVEMLDKTTIEAAEAGLSCGYPPDAGAVLLLEVDGIESVATKQARQARAICLENGSREVRVAETPEERELLWRGRKGAIGALGYLAPNYYILDGVVPRSRLGEVMAGVATIEHEFGLRIANVFHAGDGNLHPCILFDDRVEGAKEKVLDAGAKVMQLCIDAGGALSGEHGIGHEKRRFMNLVYSEADLENMERLRGVFGNNGLFNPCKILPGGAGCGEVANQSAAMKAAGADAYV